MQNEKDKTIYLLTQNAHFVEFFDVGFRGQPENRTQEAYSLRPVTEDAPGLHSFFSLQSSKWSVSFDTVRY